MNTLSPGWDYMDRSDDVDYDEELDNGPAEPQDVTRAADKD